MSDKKSKQQLNEIRLSWAGKLFFAGVAARLAQVGLKKLANSMEEQAEEGSEQGEIGFPFKLQGTPEQIAATGLNVGVIFGLTVIVMAELVAGEPF